MEAVTSQRLQKGHHACNRAVSQPPRSPEIWSAKQQGTTIDDYRDRPTSERAFEPAGRL